MSVPMEQPVKGTSVKVSVVLTCYNGREWIDGAIQSVLGQTLRDLQLIVVDDGSSDGSREMASKYLPDGRVVLIAQENRGVAAARNRGLDAASGEYVCILDQDDRWLPGKLAAQAAYLDRESGVSAVYTGVERVDGAGGSLGLRSFPPPLEGDLFRAFLSRGVAVPIISVMFRRKALRDLGGFDEKLFGKDDFDLLLRLARESRIGFLPEVLTIQRFRRGTAGQSEPMHTDSFYLAEKYRRLWPDSIGLTDKFEAGARYLYGSVLLESGRKAEAREQFSALLRKRPLHFKAMAKYLLSYV